MLPWLIITLTTVTMKKQDSCLKDWLVEPDIRRINASDFKIQNLEFSVNQGC